MLWLNRMFWPNGRMASAASRHLVVDGYGSLHSGSKAIRKAASASRKAALVLNGLNAETAATTEAE